MSADLRSWIAGRTPPVPGDFGRWMTPEAGEAGAGVDALANEAERALSRALNPQGRARGGAFDLLAADGFLTWACEAAIESDDPDGELQRLIERFSE